MASFPVARIGALSVAALLALPGCLACVPSAQKAGGSATGGPVTIVVGPGPFATVEEAAKAEQRVAWRDGDGRDETACTASFAATELRHHLAACLRVPDSTIALSGADALPARGRVFLLTSDPADPRLAGLDTTSAPALPGGDGQGFRVFSSAAEGRVVHVIQGAGPVATLHGVYSVLERLGVRFYGLGERGTVLPAQTVTLPDTLRWAGAPAFVTRGFWAWEPRGSREFFLWMARNRLNVWTAAEKEEDLPYLRKLGIRLTQGGHIIQKTFLDPAGEYPYRHVRFAASRQTAPDPYPVSPQYLGDRDRDGRLSYFESHPEWYGLVGGKRSDHIQAESGNNYCTSNADATRELAKNLVSALAGGAWRNADILVFWMLDHGHWCECKRCRALGTPTDRLFRVLAVVREALHAAAEAGTLRRPVTVTSLAFLETMQPPTRPVPSDFDSPDFAFTYFPIDRCYAHALADPACTEINQGQLREYEGWGVAPGRFYRGAIAVGEYYNVSSFYSLPILYTRILSLDIPWYHRNGARHFNYMHVPTRDWGPWTLNHALLARLLWDPRTDVDRTLREYFALYYPATSVSTRRFYESLETATANFKLLKHRARAGRSIYGVVRQLRAGALPLPLEHMRYETFHPPKNDAPDIADMKAAMQAARAALEQSLARCPAGSERERLGEDERRLRYAEATLAFFDHLLRLYAFDRQGDAVRAREEWKGLAAAAARLRRMVDVVQVSSRDANAVNAFVATEAVDIYEAFARRYGAPR